MAYPGCVPAPPDGPSPDDRIVIPALLRAARGSYAHAIRDKLAEAGFDDLPRNGSFVLGGMANYGGSASEMIRGLGVSKQAASQLIDTLVVRGYLMREINPDDRRRMLIELTERGRSAAVMVRAAIDEVDAELKKMVSPSQIAGLRAGLEALAKLREKEHS